ncbi:hypothetical protein J6590_102141 [Homalodisca vitripennis]|nr:hypothetical protein J6590_102141 [Homalodisca vitripennis]
MLEAIVFDVVGQQRWRIEVQQTLAGWNARSFDLTDEEAETGPPSEREQATDDQDCYSSKFAKALG